MIDPTYIKKIDLTNKSLLLLIVFLIIGCVYSNFEQFTYGRSCSDFYSFWSAAKAIRLHMNPYDVQQIIAAGIPKLASCKSLLGVYNTPFIFLFTYPLSLLAPLLSSALWLAFSVYLFILAIDYLSKSRNIKSRLF